MYLWYAKVEYSPSGDYELCDFHDFLTPPCDIETAARLLLKELGEGYKIVTLDLKRENVLDLR